MLVCNQSIIFFCFVSLNLFSLAVFLIGVYSLRFQMTRFLYFRIVHFIEEHDYYFVQKRDRNERLGLSFL
jgi:hypothetical protein